MRLLIVQPWISYRGSETVSLLEAVYWEKLGGETAVACLFVDWGRISDRFHNVDFILPPVLLSRLFASSRLIRAVLGFPTLFFLVLVHSRGFDALNPHNLPSVWVCALVKPFTKAAVVWTVHGVPKRAHPESSLFEKLIWSIATSPIDRWAVDKADLVICVSRKVRDDVKRRYGRESHILYPPVDVERSACGHGTIVREALGVGEKDFVLLHVSYLHPAKNVDISIGTLARIQMKVPNARLIIVGGGPQEPALKKLAQSLGVADQIVFAGFVEPSRICHFYSAADLVVVPYWETEGNPLVVLEAVSAGKPSVVAEGSGADELAESEGLAMVASPTVDDFSQKVIQFHHSQEAWSAKLQGAKRFVEERLSGEGYAKELRRLLHSQIDGVTRKISAEIVEE